LLALEEGWQLSGVAVFLHEDVPCRLDYVVTTDKSWRTTAATVTGLVGKKAVLIKVVADAERQWLVNGVVQQALKGCLDIDLSFSPATNLLPIRRLDLPIGGEEKLDAAWLRFPGLSFERLDQVYRRTQERTYNYQSGGGTFTADLTVNGVGWVVTYPGLWEVDAGS
jgi:hypothetical protein